MLNQLDIEINYATEADTTPMAPPPPTVKPSLNGGWDTGVSEHSSALVEGERAIAKEFGFKHDDGELFYAAGTQLADMGYATTEKLAEEYAKLPSIMDAAKAHAATIAAERRQDRTLTPCEWRLNTVGKLYNIKEPTSIAALSDTAWAQLGMEQVKVPHTSAPRGNMNAWLGQVPSSVIRKARVRGSTADSREIFAMVSNGSRGYVAYDSDKALYDLARAMPGAKCEVEYDAPTTRLKARAYVQAPIDVKAFTGVGRVHQAGVQFMTRDDGMMGLTGRAFIERIRCKNHTLVCEKLGAIRRRHTGTYEQLREQLAKLVGKMPKMIEQLQALWGNAAANYYLDSESGLQLSAPEAIARLVMNGHLSTGGLDNDDAIAAYVAAWRAEDSPHSAAGVIMAVQRAAHETSWRTRWSEDEIEQGASDMLYQPVYTLDEIGA